MTNPDETTAERSLARARRWLDSFEDFIFDEDGRIDRYLNLGRGELRAALPSGWAKLHEDLYGDAGRLERGLERLAGSVLAAKTLNALDAAQGLLAALRISLYDIDFDGDPNERYRADVYLELASLNL